MSRTAVSITTRDGICPASVFTPASGAGPWPGIIFFMDGPGIRPAVWEMGQRLADYGYVVLLPDMYYRSGPYEPMVPGELFADPDLRAGMMEKLQSLDRDKKISDTEAFIAFLAARPDVRGDRFGTTGYCMGGNISLTVAAAFPERLAATASFHGGNLAGESPESPHRFAAAITSRVYVAGAIEDASFPDEQKALLERTLEEAGVEHTVETYAARHGFAVPDMPTFDVAAADRHWAALAQLFGATLL
jgi:carboxymethylenebutenolidase